MKYVRSSLPVRPFPYPANAGRARSYARGFEVTLLVAPHHMCPGEPLGKRLRRR